MTSMRINTLLLAVVFGIEAVIPATNPWWEITNVVCLVLCMVCCYEAGKMGK